jgi:hypothetical protein
VSFEPKLEENGTAEEGKTLKGPKQEGVSRQTQGGGVQEGKRNVSREGAGLEDEESRDLRKRSKNVKGIDLSFWRNRKRSGIDKCQTDSDHLPRCGFPSMQLWMEGYDCLAQMAMPE